MAGRPRKQPLALNTQSPAAPEFEPIVPLTDEEINEALEEYAEYGIKLTMTGDRGILKKGKLSVGFNRMQTANNVRYAADLLISNDFGVRRANKRNANGERLLGDVTGAGGVDLIGE